MAKGKKRRTWPFLLGMGIYAAVFLGAVWYGLGQFSVFLDAYERSRPQIAINRYMDSLTADYIVEKSQALVDQIDHNIQTEEECREVIRDAVSAPFSYAKKNAECTEDKQVFVIRSGMKVIGSMQIQHQEDLGFGFTSWAVTGDSFDLSYLISETVSAKVPQDYTVLVNGKPLDAGYQTENNIPYEALSMYYGVYDLPHMVSYQAGPCLGKIELQVLDATGSPATADLEPVEYLKNCTEQEAQDLDDITEDFLIAYLYFSTRKNKDSEGNYKTLCQYMVKDGELSVRMKNSIGGLSWTGDRKAVFGGYDVALMTNLGGGRYLVDVTYNATVTMHKGPENWTIHVHLVILNTPEGLRVEAMNAI